MYFSKSELYNIHPSVHKQFTSHICVHSPMALSGGLALQDTFKQTVGLYLNTQLWLAVYYGLALGAKLVPAGSWGLKPFNVSISKRGLSCKHRAILYYLQLLHVVMGCSTTPPSHYIPQQHMRPQKPLLEAGSNGICNYWFMSCITCHINVSYCLKKM